MKKLVLCLLIVFCFTSIAWAEGRVVTSKTLIINDVDGFFSNNAKSMIGAKGTLTKVFGVYQNENYAKVFYSFTRDNGHEYKKDELLYKLNSGKWFCPKLFKFVTKN